jgi:methionyl-tRNA formyltransferase
LPGWLLASVRHGVFGMHASQYPLPRGRGRSPITWGIINGADRLHGQIFRYGSEADSGPLLADVPIDVLPHDDVHSVQQKCRVAFNRTVEAHWDRLLAGTAALRTPAGEAGNMFYPKRTPDDGRIDWRWPVRRLVDWVRAQTRPYPGAFCVMGGQRRKIWRVHSFGMAFEPTPAVGAIVERFTEGSYVVQAGDGTVHLTDHELPHDLPIGTRLS